MLWEIGVRWRVLQGVLWGIGGAPANAPKSAQCGASTGRDFLSSTPVTGCHHCSSAAAKTRAAKTRFGGSQKRVVSKKGGFGGYSPVPKTGTRVRSHVPPEQNRNDGDVHMFPRNENRNEGTFSPKPPFYETALLSPNHSLHGVFFQSADACP